MKIFVVFRNLVKICKPGKPQVQFPNPDLVSGYKRVDGAHMPGSLNQLDTERDIPSIPVPIEMDNAGNPSNCILRYMRLTGSSLVDTGLNRKIIRKSLNNFVKMNNLYHFGSKIDWTTVFGTNFAASNFGFLRRHEARNITIHHCDLL